MKGIKELFCRVGVGGGGGEGKLKVKNKKAKKEKAKEKTKKEKAKGKGGRIFCSSVPYSSPDATGDRHPASLNPDLPPSPSGDLAGPGRTPPDLPPSPFLGPDGPAAARVTPVLQTSHEDGPAGSCGHSSIMRPSPDAGAAGSASVRHVTPVLQTSPFLSADPDRDRPPQGFDDFMDVDDGEVVLEHLTSLGSDDLARKLKALCTLAMIFAQEPGEVVQIAPCLKSLMGPRFFSHFDHAAEVAQAARRSFQAAFPQSDRNMDALMLCVKETFQYLNENLKRATQALPDKVIPMDELQNMHERIRRSALDSMKMWRLTKESVSGLYSILFSSEPTSHLQFAAYSLLMSEPLCQLPLVKCSSQGEIPLSSQESDMGQSSELVPDSEIYLRDELSALIEMPSSELAKTDLIARERVNVFVAWALVLSHLQLLPLSSTTRANVLQYIQDKISPCILDFIFQHIPLRTAAPSGKQKEVELLPQAKIAAEASKNAITTCSLLPYVESLWPAGVLQMASLAGSLYGMMIRLLPSYVHTWLTSLSDRSLSYAIESFTRTWCSPPLLLDEFSQVISESEIAMGCLINNIGVMYALLKQRFTLDIEGYVTKVDELTATSECLATELASSKAEVAKLTAASKCSGADLPIPDRLDTEDAGEEDAGEEDAEEEDTEEEDASNEKYVRFTAEEMSTIRRGAAQANGRTSWVRMLQRGTPNVFHRSRRPEHLRRKWKYMKNKEKKGKNKGKEKGKEKG